MKTKNLMAGLIIVAAFLVIFPVNVSADTYNGAWEPTFNNPLYSYSLTYTVSGTASFYMYDDGGTPTPGSGLLLLNNSTPSNLVFFDILGDSYWYASLDPNFSSGNYFLGTTNNFRFFFYDSSSHISYNLTEIEAGKQYSLNEPDTDTTVQVVGAAPIPIPATVWIFGAGLVGLVGIRKKLKS